MEARKLPDTELKTLVIRMLKEDREHFNKEISIKRDINPAWSNVSKFTKSVGCRAVIRTCASWLLAQCSFYCMHMLGVGPCQVFHRQIIVHEIQSAPFSCWEKKDMFLFLMLRVVIGKIKEGLSAGVREIKRVSRNTPARAGLIYSDSTRVTWQSGGWSPTRYQIWVPGSSKLLICPL